MEKKWDIVEILRHSRHDWLNRLQLIKGNLDLDRMDRAKAVIDRIIIETQNEAKLSNLKMPLFASLLLKANWEGHLFQLEYEVLHANEAEPINEEAITNWTSAFFAALDKTAAAFQENSLSISIDPLNDGIRFFFDFSGILTGTKQMSNFLEQKAEPGITIKKFSDRELTLEIFMPFS